MKEVKSNYRFIIFTVIFQFLIMPAILVISIIVNMTNDISTLLITVLSFYFGYLIFYKQYKIDIKKQLRIANHNIFEFFYDIISCFFIILVSSLIIGIISSLIANNFTIEISSDGLNLELTPLYIIYICVLAPIIEEIMFRGFAYNSLKVNGEVTAIILSSLLFALFHFNYVQFPTTLMLGIVTCSINNKYKSILPGILLHIMNNITALLPFYLDTLITVLYVIMFLLVIIFLIKRLKGKKLNIIESTKNAFSLSFKSISFYLVVLLNIVLFILEILGYYKGLY